MPDFITLSCPSCGHKLQITDDVDKFACAACGNEHVVNRGGGIITLKPIVDSIRSVQVGVDKTASELAIVRINKEIIDLERDLNKINVERSNSISLRVARDTTWIILFMIGATIFFMVSILSHSTSGIITSLFIAGGMTLAYLKTLKEIKHEEENRKLILKQIDMQTASINNSLNTKKMELVSHQKIVSNK